MIQNRIFAPCDKVGDLPISKLKLVIAWAEIHKEELLEMWESKEFHKVEPLR